MKKPIQHMNLTEQMMFIGRAICSVPILDDANEGEVVITFYHQINKNILDLLTTAKTKVAMEEMLRERMNPMNYQRLKAPPSVGQVDMAMDSLGDFSVTMHTVEELDGHDDTDTIGGVAAEGDQTATSTSAYDELKKSVKKTERSGKIAIPRQCASSTLLRKLHNIQWDMVTPWETPEGQAIGICRARPSPPRSAGAKTETGVCGFAARVEGTSNTTFTSPRTMTMTEFIENSKNGNIKTAQMYCNNMNGAYSAKTTLNPSMIIDIDNNEKYLWSFLRNDSTRYNGLTYRLGEGQGAKCFVPDGYYTVTHVKRIKTHMHNGYIFVLKNSRYTLQTAPITENCLFPEFLVASKKKTCGRTFEALNKTLKLNIPQEGQLALGVGASTIDTKGTLSSTLSVCINGAHYKTIISKE